jgi:peptidoglycan/LPS O-acetylase OafA/YrhL
MVDSGTRSEGLLRRSNAFGFLRITFALLVVVDHSFYLGGYGKDPMLIWSRGQLSFGSLSVYGFFAISGYLVALSASRLSPVRFLWHRILRIFPAYWLMLLVTALIVCPAVWMAEHRTLSAYLAGPDSPSGFIVKNALLSVGQWSIHDIFSTSPWGQIAHGSFVNGSIWTLIYEWHCYLLLGCLALVGVGKKFRAAILCLGAAFVLLNLVEAVRPGSITGRFPELDSSTLLLTLVFLFGSMVALYAVPFIDVVGWPSLVIFVVTLITGTLSPLEVPLLVYVTLWAAYRLPAPLRAIGSENDYSYGTYIYGFLVIQMLSWMGLNRLPWFVFASTGCALSVLAGAASWHIIEQRALTLKSFSLKAWHTRTGT